MNPEQKPKPAPKRRLKVIIVALVGILVVSVWQASQQGLPQIPVISSVAQVATKVATEEQPGLYIVEEVDDGDTIVVSQGGKKETIRFIGIDTPETKDPRKPAQCFGLEATAKTKSLLEGTKVRLEPDTIGDNRDKYQRLLRYVYLPDGTFMNELLVQEGYAFAYTIFPFDKLDDFVAAQEQARADLKGLWTACEVNETKSIKQTNSL